MVLVFGAALRFVLLLLLLYTTTGPSVCFAQSSLGVDISRDRASIVNNGVDATWITDRFQVNRVDPEAGGWFLGAERHDRSGVVDATGFASAYKRAGAWTARAGIAGTPHARFQYRVSVEGELSRRLTGGLVATGGYRYLSFNTVNLQQAQPALAWYHARGEVQGRLFLSWRDTEPGATTAVLVQTLYDFNPRLRVRAGGSSGDRIFDVALLARGGHASARVAFASVRIGVTKHDFIEIGGSVAHEEPAFDYKSIALGYRRAF